MVVRAKRKSWLKMEVLQKFCYSMRGYKYHITVSRFPNANGCIEKAWRWAEHFEDSNAEQKVYATSNLTAEEKENILDHAGELWDQYWTVDNLKCAKAWAEWHKENKQNVT